MAALGRRDQRFFDLTRLRQVGTRYFAVAGLRQTVITAHYVNGLVSVLGETEDLGAEARDIAAHSSTLYILTDSGLKVASLGDVPVVAYSHAFDPDDGAWVFASGSYVVAPIKGGVQVINPGVGQVHVAFPPSMHSGIAACLSTDDILYVADERKAQIHVFRILDSLVRYVDSFRAPNCHDIVTMVLDENKELLFVVCKNRIVSFTVPNGGVEDDDISVTKFVDYGKSADDYTDFVVVPGGYWVGIDADSAMNPTAGRFFGPQYALFDASAGDNGNLIVAYPKASWFAASNVIPYLTEENLGDTTNPGDIVDPPIILPDPPVITSALSEEILEGGFFEYTITATGTPPITFGFTPTPPWDLVGNPLTGYMSSIAPGAGVYDIPISATNAGGTTEETLVVTVDPLPTTVTFHLTQAIVAALPGPCSIIAHIPMGNIPSGFVVSSTTISVATPLAWPAGFGDNSTTGLKGSTTGHDGDLFAEMNTGDIGAGGIYPAPGPAYDNIDMDLGMAPRGLVAFTYYSQVEACDITFVMTLVPGP